MAGSFTRKQKQGDRSQGGEGGRGATVLRRVIILITFMSANRNFVNSIVILLMTIIKILMIIVKSMMVNPIARNILNIAKKKVHKK